MMSDTHLRIRQMSLDLNSPSRIPLNVRIAEFRQDPQNMDQMTEFVDELIVNAQSEADRRRAEQKTEMKKLGKGTISNFQSSSCTMGPFILRCETDATPFNKQLLCGRPGDN